MTDTRLRGMLVALGLSLSEVPMSPAFILTLALFSPGDPILMQAARLSGLESAIINAAPPDDSVTPGAWGHRQLSIQYATIARHRVNYFLQSPAAYQPFGWPGSGGIFLRPDIVDGLIGKAETHFAASL